MASSSVPVPRAGHQVPGDKSITHRALLLASLAEGQSVIHRPLVALDTRSTARVLRQLGAEVSPLRRAAPATVRGRGGPKLTAETLHCGNSGTTARLLLGLLAGGPGAVRLTGDHSLRRRPMGRVTEPLSQMGARFQGQRERLPLTMVGGRLSPLIWQSPVASAQVKGALLLAGVSGGVPVSVTEPTQSRDHTERMLASFGFGLNIEGTTVHFEPTGRITPFELTVPGDPSSAAFLVAAAILGGSRPVRISGVGLNPTRTGFLRVLSRMGRPVAQEGTGLAAGEPIGDLVTSGGILRSTIVTAPEIPALVDEVPILACLAARAEGETRFEGLSELRVKESDRLALLATNLRAIGIEASVSGDDLTVVGSDRPLAGHVVTDGDHRIAMAFAVLGHGHPVSIDDPDCAAVSFPGFEAAVAAVHQEVA